MSKTLWHKEFGINLNPLPMDKGYEANIHIWKNGMSGKNFDGPICKTEDETRQVGLRLAIDIIDGKIHKCTVDDL